MSDPNAPYVLANQFAPVHGRDKPYSLVIKPLDISRILSYALDDAVLAMQISKGQMLRNYSSIGFAILLCGCSASSDHTGSYVGGDDTGLIKLTIVEADDQRVNATLSIAQLDYEAGKIDTTTGGLTGIRNGDAINLIAANGNGGSMSLIVDGGNLLWQMPDTGQSIELIETDQAEYQKRLIALSQNLTANDVGLLPNHP